MKIVIQSVHFKASPQLEDFVNKKAAKLFRQNDRIVRADVTLYKGANGNPRNEFCEIRLLVPGNDYFVKKNSSTYEESVPDAVQALQKMIRRDKMKKLQKRRPERANKNLLLKLIRDE